MKMTPEIHPDRMKQKISLKSWILVAIQLGCLFYIYYSAPLKAIRIDLQIWELSGLFLAISGLFGLSWHSFSVFPEPKTKGRLITDGIFSFIRHPMYAGVLVVVGTLVIQFFTVPRLICLLILAAVFILKIVDEEVFLSKRFSEYADYQQKTNRLIPFIW
jgi:protein-S-isoprenylcysteine O-methyltransferase Ste14